MKILKGLQSCIIVDNCVEFKVRSEGNKVVIDFRFIVEKNKSLDNCISKFYPLSNSEIEALKRKDIEIDYICYKLNEKLCNWLSSNDTAYFSLKKETQEIIDSYLGV